jgi:hypothetical protein
MRAVSPVLVLLCLAGPFTRADARPIVIEDSATLANPDTAEFASFGTEVATNGEYALALGSRDEYVYEPPNEERNIHIRSALLYRRVGGTWSFQQVLRQTRREYDSYNYPHSFAMKGNLAAVGLDGITEAYLLGASGWQPAGQITGPTEDTEIDGERIVFSYGDCQWSAGVVEPDGTGGWIGDGLAGQPRGCDDEHWGGPVDLSVDRVIIGTPDTNDLEVKEIPIFQRTGPDSWYRYSSIVETPGRAFRGEVAIRGDDAIVDAFNGPYVFRIPDLNTPAARLQSADAYLTNATSLGRNTVIEKYGDLVLVREPSWDRGVYVINVFRAQPGGGYQHVAVLAPRNGGSVGDSIDIGGNTVVASGNGLVYVFQLPASFTTPAPRYDNFETATATNWTPLPGSQFVVVASGANRVYRQSNTAGDARALLGDTAWTDQAIEADIKPTLFDGNDRWAGLLTRYQDAQNHYYVALRSSGLVQLRRMRAGMFSTIAQAPLPVRINRSYRVRLESIGSVHRVYVDGQLLIDADDAGAPHSGSAGLAMYRTRADYDNVIVTPSPLTTVFTNDFATARTGSWTYTGTGQWTAASGAFAQSSVDGEARAIIGTPLADQIVAARVRPIAYAAGGTQERWLGIVARHSDDRNYYYLTLRSGNTLSLRKLVNGAITTLASVTLNAAPNTTYRLRLEAVGTQLRAYVNGVLTLQATDSSHAAGAGGLMTYKTAAQFDDYLAYQP